MPATSKAYHSQQRHVVEHIFRIKILCKSLWFSMIQSTFARSVRDFVSLWFEFVANPSRAKYWDRIKGLKLQHFDTYCGGAAVDEGVSSTVTCVLRQP